jgi:small subunit ribosomal protein S20
LTQWGVASRNRSFAVTGSRRVFVRGASFIRIEHDWSEHHAMANTASARKRIRQTEKRTARNRARRSRMRTFLRKVEQAIAGGDKAQAQEAFRAAQPELQRAATKGVVHRNAVTRKLSRLSARIKALGGGGGATTTA